MKMKLCGVFCGQVALFLACAGTVSCISESMDEPGIDKIVAGDRLPDFEVKMNNGLAVCTDDLSGKVSVITFFNTLCPDCRKELPVLQKVYERYAGNDSVAVVAISREEGADDVARYWSQYGLTIPYSAQEGREVYELFCTSGIPRVYISDRETVVRYVHNDVDMPSYDELTDEIDVLLHQ